MDYKIWCIIISEKWVQTLRLYFKIQEENHILFLTRIIKTRNKLKEGNWEGKYENN